MSGRIKNHKKQNKNIKTQKPDNNKISHQKRKITKRPPIAITKSPKSAKSAKSKSSLYLAVAGTIIFMIIAIVVIGNLNRKSYEEYDLKGLTIKEACEKARSAGWEINGVVSKDGSDKTDCYNENIKVTDYAYYDYSKSVYIYFGEKKTEEQEKSEVPSSTSPSSDSSSSSSNVNASFREVMDGYEKFMDEYINFMKKYKNASTAEISSMMSDYTNIIKKYSEWSKKIQNYNSNNLSADDYAYYLEVYSRVIKKMSTAY